MDPADHAQLAAEAARTGLDTWCEVRVPFDGTPLDGAVVELRLHPGDGIFTGEIRIPGPPVP